MNQIVPLLNVEDVGRSIDFYQTALGASVENQWEMDGRLRWARVSFEGGALMLNTPDTVSSEARREREEFSDVVLYAMCEDAPARRKGLETSGIATGPLHEEDYGSYEFSVRDPDGYVIRFSSPR